MNKACYTHKPEPVTLQRHGRYIHATIAITPQQREHDEAPPQWEADTHQFWEEEDKLDLDALKANPASYLHYIPHATRQAAKDKAQQMLDALREACPAVPVPGYREGAAVCNRPADQVKLVAGLAMGGLPYFELASGEIVNLSEDDIKAIATDLTSAETAWQQAKQQCWASIDRAQGDEELASALAQFAETLDSFAGAPASTRTSTSNNARTSWIAGLLNGWAPQESWAKILAGTLAGALATSVF